MNRLLAPLLLAICMSAALPSQAQTSASQEKHPVLKAVIHINFKDPDRHEHALHNVENILKDASDTELIVVCHGEGIALLSKKQTKQAELVQSLMKKGVRFEACENTMQKKSLSKEDLLEGTKTVPSGAVEIIRKQSEGYSYFKP
ncbi:MAG: DsrE family protein [Aureliella sp.]